MTDFETHPIGTQAKLDRLEAEVSQLTEQLTRKDEWLPSRIIMKDDIKRLTTEGARKTDVIDHLDVEIERLSAETSKLTDVETSSDRQNFYVEESNGFFWVTERATGHNHAQTDTKEKANQICRDLNSGVRKFETDGTPAEPGHCPYCNQGMHDGICGKTTGVGDGFVGFACTRSPSHEGDHVACGVHHRTSTWSNTASSSRGDSG